jgi:hypothetical protein
MAGPQKSETLQKPTVPSNIETTVNTLTRDALKKGADVAAALQAAAEAAAHQPGGHLHNQAED